MLTPMCRLSPGNLPFFALLLLLTTFACGENTTDEGENSEQNLVNSESTENEEKGSSSNTKGDSDDAIDSGESDSDDDDESDSQSNDSDSDGDSDGDESDSGTSAAGPAFPRCVGTIERCSLQTAKLIGYDSCELALGCINTSVRSCKGNNSTCQFNTSNPTACNKKSQLGCSWSPTSAYCAGAVLNNDCSEISVDADCGLLVGCTWESGEETNGRCSGGVASSVTTACEQLSDDTNACTADGGCAISGTCGTVDGDASACSSASTEAACSASLSCTWFLPPFAPPTAQRICVPSFTFENCSMNQDRLSCALTSEPFCQWISDTPAACSSRGCFQLRDKENCEDSSCTWTSY